MLKRNRQETKDVAQATGKRFISNSFHTVTALQLMYEAAWTVCSMRILKQHI